MNQQENNTQGDTCSIRNGRPSAQRFRFAPRSFGHLNEFVESAEWDSVNKLLRLVVGETPKFEVTKWLKHIEGQQAEYSKSPFMDVDSNSAVMDFFDRCGHKIATTRFKNLGLQSHSCMVNRRASADQDFLSHNCVISYQTAETVVHSDMGKAEEPTK